MVTHLVRLPRIARLAKRPSRVVGAVLLGIVILLCTIVPILSPYGETELVAAPLLAPSWEHPFGTDVVGRDVFVRTFAGGRVDLLAAFIVVGFSAVFGTVLGTIAGAATNRWIDGVVMRIVDALLSIPMIVLLLAIIMVVGVDISIGPLPPGLPAAMIAMMLIGWSSYARLARGQALVYRESDFVTAARVSGLSSWRIITRHIAPGVGRVSAAHAVGDVVATVVLLASLPFLGAGVQPPAAEWGSIMYEGRGFILQAWWIVLCPGAVLLVTGLGLSFLGDSFLDEREER